MGEKIRKGMRLKEGPSLPPLKRICCGHKIHQTLKTEKCQDTATTCLPFFKDATLFGMSYIVSKVVLSVTQIQMCQRHHECKTAKSLQAFKARTHTIRPGQEYEIITSDKVKVRSLEGNFLVTANLETTKLAMPRSENKGSILTSYLRRRRPLFSFKAEVTRKTSAFTLLYLNHL